MHLQQNLHAEYLHSVGVPRLVDMLLKRILKTRPETASEACYQLCTDAGEKYQRIIEANSIKTPDAKLACGLARGQMIGKGAFGEVYKGLDRYGTVYAVKVMCLKGCTMDEALNEYSVLKQLSHRNIVRVWDFSVADNLSTAEIVMSFWTQGSIAHQIMEFGALPQYTVRKYTAQLLAGLGYLHSCGILHRDLKPQNMLADTTGCVALTDFGLSTSVLKTEVNMTIGSPPYMSPMVVTTSRYSEQSDLWALGCSILEMVTAKMTWSAVAFGSESWGPAAYLYASGSAAKTGKTPLDNISRNSIPEDLQSFLLECFRAERTGSTYKHLVASEFLDNPRRSSMLRFKRASLYRLPFYKAERDVLSGRTTIYLSVIASLLHDDERNERVEAILAGPVAHASPFSRTDIKRKTEPGIAFNNTSTDRTKMYCHRKRPAHTLLYLLGRTEDCEDVEPGLPHIELKPHPVDRPDDDAEITVSGKIIDKIALEERVKKLSIDDIFDNSEEKEKMFDGPSAVDIYGDNEFRITIGELKRLIQSTHVSTASTIPKKFFSDLLRFTTMKSMQQTWSIHRACPLIKFGVLTSELQILSQLESDDRSISLNMNNTSVDVGAWRKKKDTITSQIQCQRNLVNCLQADETNPIKTVIGQFEEWKHHILQFPYESGFSSAADGKAAIELSLTELCTGVCISQQGYFLVDGCDGDHNQLTSITPQPVTFLSATGLDFRNPSSTVLEASKYFKRPPQPLGIPRHTGWKGFTHLALNMLKERLKETYRTIFNSAKYHGAKNLSMLPMGLGMFLQNVHPDDRGAVRGAYFTAQFELLTESDWGIDAYYLNCGLPEQRAIAEECLEAVLGGRGSEAAMAHLSCDVILHCCDAKFLAAELSKRCMSAAMLNPSDCSSVVLGLMGTYWEKGRGNHYSGEEDFIAHTTGSLARAGIAVY